MLLTQAELHSLFEYRDGFLFWKCRQALCIQVGDIAGTKNVDGYWRVMINRKQHSIHRIIFLMHNGYLPRVVDHIDRNRSNNKIENLREATPSQNQHNRAKSKNNTSGYKGVSFNKPYGKWQAAIKVNWKAYNIGYFDTAEAASIAYADAAKRLHGEFARAT